MSSDYSFGATLTEGDSPSFWLALALMHPVFYLKWSCTRSKALSCSLSCLHLFLAFVRLLSVCQCFSCIEDAQMGYGAPSVNSKIPKIERISVLGFFWFLWVFFFLCSLANTSQTIFGLYLHIINNWVSLRIKGDCNIHSYCIIQTG